MYRLIMNDLLEWYEHARDRVLVLKGAEGVGKTWAMLDFGRGFFRNVIYISPKMDEDTQLLYKRGGRMKADRWLRTLASFSGERYKEGNTLLLFDEPQKHPKALDAIMNLKRQKPGAAIGIIASTVGELPREAEYREEWDMLQMYPMTFEEFLTANRAQELCHYIENQKLEPVSQEVIAKISEYLKLFYVVGGMPEVVSDYIHNRNMDRVDGILSDILKRMEMRISEEAPGACAPKAERIFQSIPAQMKKENRKFMYQYVDEKARAREYERSVNWLADSGMVRRVYRIRDGVAPLNEHIDEKSFELYHLDHGLLRVMCDVGHRHLLTGEREMEDLNGALLEQLVLSELTMNRTVQQLYFWISGATARVNFVFEDDGDVVPVDVQTAVRGKAQSMKVFNAKYHNHMAIRISMEKLGFEKGILNIPLYGLWNF